ncbi:growth arrest and DNA damage-inducible protein GADD45 alpha [Onthophagus taurus]|uniref:growth arrest and DNA damage-inducible protein GADD45 alpha n=1 Tax=Onthophagus taurus TaxID=166361 RepID=UPI000C20934A|nr:growth arrest and DNA damage-inducible protein GADD45 alpha [Onthophagus taurus]
MCIAKFDQSKGTQMNRNIGQVITGVLAQAKSERRLIHGLYETASYLHQNPDDVLVCLLPETRTEDPTIHMQEVLLEAFCYEYEIPVIRVDSSKRLGELCEENSACSCAIVTRDPNIPWDENSDPPVSPEEKTLQDFYEYTLEQFPRPVIELPI